MCDWTHSCDKTRNPSCALVHIAHLNILVLYTCYILECTILVFSNSFFTFLMINKLTDMNVFSYYKFNLSN